MAAAARRHSGAEGGRWKPLAEPRAPRPAVESVGGAARGGVAVGAAAPGCLPSAADYPSARAVSRLRRPTLRNSSRLGERPGF